MLACEKRGANRSIARDRRLVTANLWLPAEHSTAPARFGLKTGVFLVVAALKRHCAAATPGYTAAKYEPNQ